MATLRELKDSARSQATATLNDQAEAMGGRDARCLQAVTARMAPAQARPRRSRAQQAWRAAAPLACGASAVCLRTEDCCAEFSLSTLALTLRPEMPCVTSPTVLVIVGGRPGAEGLPRRRCQSLDSKNEAAKSTHPKRKVCVSHMVRHERITGHVAPRPALDKRPSGNRMRNLFPPAWCGTDGWSRRRSSKKPLPPRQSPPRRHMTTTCMRWTRTTTHTSRETACVMRACTVTQ